MSPINLIYSLIYFLYHSILKDEGWETVEILIYSNLIFY
jgi:hypothetical protein